MSTIGEHQGDGIRFNMYLSAPNGGVAQMLRNPEGQWVSWNEYEKLKAEVELLRKAGDAMAEAFNLKYPVAGGLINAWNAAKEGMR